MFFYIDDIFVFYKTNNDRLSKLMDFLQSLWCFFWSTDGNVSKSPFFSPLKILFFNGRIKDVLGYNMSSILFKYLVVLIFISATKIRYFQSLAYKMKNKLAIWKGKTLNIMRRIRII